jgi:hypothetical protein
MHHKDNILFNNIKLLLNNIHSLFNFANRVGGK